MGGGSFIHTNSGGMALIESQDHLQRYSGSRNTQCEAAKVVQVSSRLVAGLTTLVNHSELRHLHRVPGGGSTNRR